MKKLLVLLILFSFSVSVYSKTKYTKDETYYMSEICKSVEAYQIAVEKGWSSEQSQAKGKLGANKVSLLKSQPNLNKVDFKYKGKTLNEWLSDYENQRAIERAAFNKQLDAQKKKGEEIRLKTETETQPEFGINPPNNIGTNIDSHLTSWEVNNASKNLEDIGLDSINGLHADIKSITDPEKQANFFKRFEDALVILANNSLSDWRNTDIDYFTKYCMTQSFKDTVARFAKYYDLFDQCKTYNDGAFEMLNNEIVTIINNHLEASFRDWKLIIPSCDAIDTPAYVKCAESYANFVIETISVPFNGEAKFSFDNNIIQEAGDKIAMIAEVSMNEAECECLKVCKNLLTDYFEEGRSSLISKLNAFISEHCNNGCPCLWDIQFTQDWVTSESSEPLRYITNIQFKNVFIYPRGSYELSDKEREACADYIDNYGKSINTKATSYFATEEGYEYLQEAPRFKYIGLSPDGLEDTRDYKYDTPFDKLSSAYKKGVDGVFNDYHRAGWPRLTNDGYNFRGYIDIFEEIYLRKAFSVGDNKGKFIFTPVEN